MCQFLIEFTQECIFNPEAEPIPYWCRPPVDVDMCWPHKRSFIHREEDSFEHLRGEKISQLTVAETRTVLNSTVLFDPVYEFPMFVYTRAVDVGWQKGVLEQFAKGVEPMHFNQPDSSIRKKKKLGTPMKRGTKGDFAYDMRNCCYVVGYSRDNSITAWNERSKQARAVCAQTYPVAQFLENFAKDLIPQFWKEKKHIVEAEGIPLLPGTMSRASVVSFNYESVMHLDEWDRHASILFVVKPPNVKGGYLVFPEYRLKFPLDTGDVLIFHGDLTLHGTSQICIEDKEQRVYRIGYVMYL